MRSSGADVASPILPSQPENVSGKASMTPVMTVPSAMFGGAPIRIRHRSGF